MSCVWKLPPKACSSLCHLFFLLCNMFVVSSPKNYISICFYSFDFKQDSFIIIDLWLKNGSWGLSWNLVSVMQILLMFTSVWWMIGFILFLKPTFLAKFFLSSGYKTGLCVLGKQPFLLQILLADLGAGNKGLCVILKARSCLLIWQFSPSWNSTLGFMIIQLFLLPWNLFQLMIFLNHEPHDFTAEHFKWDFSKKDSVLVSQVFLHLPDKHFQNMELSCVSAAAVYSLNTSA